MDEFTGEGFLGGPSASKTSDDRGRFQSCNALPFRNRPRLSVMGHAMIVAHIIRLHFFHGPANISRLVIAVGINAVDAVCGRRSRTNIGEKAREVVAPFRTDSNASPAVIRIPSAARIQTSLLHSHPDNMLRRVREAVLESERGSVLVFQASARSGIAHCQVVRHDVRDRAAIATACPPFVTSVRKSRQTPKPFPSVIIPSAHISEIIRRSQQSRVSILGETSWPKRN